MFQSSEINVSEMISTNSNNHPIITLSSTEESGHVHDVLAEFYQKLGNIHNEALIALREIDEEERKVNSLITEYSTQLAEFADQLSSEIREKESTIAEFARAIVTPHSSYNIVQSSPEHKNSVTSHASHRAL